MTTTKHSNPKRPDVPDPEACREVGICTMTGWRWDRSKEMADLGWPIAIRINRRKFRSRAALDAFKQNLVERAVKDRAVLTRQIARHAATSGDTEATHAQRRRAREDQHSRGHRQFAAIRAVR